MKTKRYTIALLMALVIAATGIQAQSARKPVSQQKKERVGTTSTAKRQAPSQQVRSQQSRNSQIAGNSQPVRKAGTQEVRKPVSITTANNPRSTYRKPNNRISAEASYSVPVKSRTYDTRSYYGGNIYHNAYPTGKVKFHIHRDTYMNHFNVLYYPTYGNIYWTRSMYHDYRRWYPDFRWNYNYGYRIQVLSVFEAKYNLGEVAMVYGRVYATWYNEETNDYLLFFGGDFPYQQFTVVIPGHIAHRYSWRPAQYFLGEHITVTGLITTFDGSPEIVVKNKSQLSIY